MRYNLFIGRWSPFHEGHKYIIDSFINNNKPVCIAIRDTKLSEADPFSVENRKKLIEEYYKDNPLVKIITIPDIEAVCVGRDVGYNIVEVPQNIQVISGTETRKMKKKNWNNGYGLVLWFTGIPCSGKTTIINELSKRLQMANQVLDGDTFRKEVTPHLGFSDFDRLQNVLTASRIARILKDQGIITLCGFVSPTIEMRRMVKETIGDGFKLIHVKASKDVCIDRDVKGMWRKAIDREIIGFTGYDAPYEAPVSPDLVLDTEKQSINDCVMKVVDLIKYGKAI